MSLKSIAVFVDSSAAGVSRATYAVRLALQHGAHLIGLFAAPSDWQGNPAESYVRGHDAIHALIERHKEEERQAAAAAGSAFHNATGRNDISFEFRILPADETGEQALLHSLHTDLAIIGRPAPGGLPRNWSAEKLLLATGVPFLIVPDDWHGSTVAERILVGWNASREARRAIADARPLLTAAREVFIVVADAPTNTRLGEEPGADIGHYLSRHGAHVTVDRIDTDGRSIAQALLDHAIYVGADLIAFGAYSHSRASEIVFGGVTRTLLNLSPLPLFIAH
ncbi:MAG TPA: universal stress protein [Ancylobacter sp.]